MVFHPAADNWGVWATERSFDFMAIAEGRGKLRVFAVFKLAVGPPAERGGTEVFSL
jgi:hypothetical protein